MAAADRSVAAEAAADRSAAAEAAAGRSAAAGAAADFVVSASQWNHAPPVEVLWTA